MHHTGQVHFIPKESDEDGDTKFRRHVLLANCHEHGEVASLAYASSQSTEAGYGAANVLVNPTATKYRGTGFSRPTYVYPSRIVSVDPRDLEEMRGRVIDEMPAIRTALGQAIGLGTGTSSARGVAAGSWRGKFIELQPGLATEVGASLAVIVTDPEYSKQQRYQTIVPILSAAEYEPKDHDVAIADTSFLEAVDPALHDAFLWTEAIFSVFQIRDIGGSVPQCLDDASMADLDAALELYFEL